jgi:regulator of RNase E activity RraA
MAATTENLVERLLKLDTCVVSDTLDKLGINGAVIGLQPMWHCPKIAGPVITVKLKTKGDEPPIRHLCTAAVEASKPGDIIVIDHAGRDYAAGWGGILSQAAKVKGVAGVICDGAIRDLDESHEIKFPVYAKCAVSVTARGRIVEEDFNIPVSIGRVSVSPGDIAFADGSGIVFLPGARAEEVVNEAESMAAREAAMTRDVQAGKSVVEVMGTNYEQMTGAH